jgi:predicted nucleic acid-binding Zn ribbon protein
MADNEQTKICPLCAEKIKAAARVCPFCRKSQKRFFFISQFDLQMVLVLVLFVLSVFLAFWFFGTGRQYSPELHKITVLSTQFGIETTSEHTNVVVSGVLTNASSYTWKLTGFQIRFLDAAGKTVEMSNAGSEYIDLTVLPHSDRSFHLDLYSIKTVPSYDSTKMTVTEAIDPGFWFNN